MLQSVRRLPDQTTVRVVLNEESFNEATNAKAEVAFRDYCVASAGWISRSP